VLFDKIASVFEKCINILALEFGNGQPREPALCQLYRRTFVPYTGWAKKAGPQTHDHDSVRFNKNPLKDSFVNLQLNAY